MVVTGGRAGVLDTLERFRSGWERLDAGAVLATFAERDDVVVFGTDAAERWVGFDALVEPFRAQVRAFSNPAYRWAEGDPRVSVHGDIAWAGGDLHVSLEAAGQRVALTMRSTFVLELMETDWRIVHAHFSVGQETPAVSYP